MKLSVDCHTYTNPATAYINDKLFPHDDPHLMHNGRNLRKNMTPAEHRLWKHLRGKRLDAKLVIEIDGGQHAEQTAYDETRTRYLQNLGFTVIPFWNNEVLQQTDAVLTDILHKLEELKAK